MSSLAGGSRSPLNGRHPLEVMTLDESETLLGAHYDSLPAAAIVGRSSSRQPSVTIVDLGLGRPPSPAAIGLALGSSIASHKQRLPSISSVAIPSPYTEQTTITSAGEWFIYKNYIQGDNQ